jgi:hypothetical protein
VCTRVVADPARSIEGMTGNVAPSGRRLIFLIYKKIVSGGRNREPAGSVAAVGKDIGEERRAERKCAKNVGKVGGY